MNETTRMRAEAFDKVLAGEREVRELKAALAESRAEVERLTQESDEAKEDAKTLRGGLHRAMRGYFNLAELVLSGEYADIARKMAEEFQALVRPDLYDVEPMIPASHAEKVLVAVAKEAARVGAENALGKIRALAYGMRDDGEFTHGEWLVVKELIEERASCFLAGESP